MSKTNNTVNNIKSFLFYLCLCFSFYGMTQSPMSVTEANNLKNKVKSLAGKTQTIKSDFTQYKHIDFLANDIESKGKLTFKEPDQVKWEYTQPYTYSIIFKNQTVYINDDGNKSNLDVGGNKLFERLNNLIASSIRGDMFNANEFDMNFFKDDNNDLVHFLPKDPQLSEFIHAFHIWFSKKGNVQEVKMIEPSGDYTQIVFSNRTTNLPLSDADFSQ